MGALLEESSTNNDGGPLAGHEPTVDHDGDGVAVISLAPGEELHDAGFGYQPSCGNGVCGGGESCSTCAADCGTCAPGCGDGVCSAGAEDCSSCASDCGACECTSPGTATIALGYASHFGLGTMAPAP
ncbi:hypothetical protein WMF26_02370 [Sorangium sp. So ce185]|uniref:hypothetical protein n=1 Tax=Sorangium sp. So ce185 TaxID=3133287 RepID=UPI003F5EC92B